jgi:lipoprotein-releasing system permease protein
VQLRLCLALAVVSACNAKPAPAPAPAIGSAAPDPWATPRSAAGSGSAGSAGSAEPTPKWANDPPHVLRDKINGVNAHVIVLKSTSSFAEYRDVLSVVEKTAGVAAAEPFIFMELNIASANHASIGLALKAVDPKRVERVLALASNMRVGKVASLASGEPPPIILGDDLAKKLAVKLGDEVTLTPAPEAETKFEAKVFRVVGTFHVDFDEYDEKLGYVSLAAAQAMLGRGDQVMGIELTVKDLDKSAAIARAIEDAIGGPPYAVMDWYELNRDLFTALYGDRRP